MGAMEAQGRLRQEAAIVSPKTARLLQARGKEQKTQQRAMYNSSHRAIQRRERGHRRHGGGRGHGGSGGDQGSGGDRGGGGSETAEAIQAVEAMEAVEAARQRRRSRQ
jgi:hypothetical protein